MVANDLSNLVFALTGDGLGSEQLVGKIEAKAIDLATHEPFSYSDVLHALSMQTRYMLKGGKTISDVSIWLDDLIKKEASPAINMSGD